MYSNKFAAKLVNIRQLCKKDMEKLSIFMVLSTYYPTFRFLISADIQHSFLLRNSVGTPRIGLCAYPYPT